MKNDLFAPLVKQRIKNGEWWMGDCLELMKDIPNGSVDMVLCDLPYGTTACKWDTVIPFKPLWREYHRIAKERAAIVLTASQPFTSALVMSNVKNFKYDWVWNKSKVGDFVRAKLKPMSGHESVLIFSKGAVANGSKRNMNYNPQGLKRVNKIAKNSTNPTEGFAGRNKENYGPNNKLHQPTYIQEFEGYPNTKLNIQSNKKGFHPTQKPVALFEYLIKTYTNEGDLVLDNTAGSGTTAIASENTSRRWICIERDPDYSRKAIERIRSC